MTSEANPAIRMFALSTPFILLPLSFFFLLFFFLLLLPLLLFLLLLLLDLFLQFILLQRMPLLFLLWLVRLGAGREEEVEFGSRNRSFGDEEDRGLEKEGRSRISAREERGEGGGREEMGKEGGREERDLMGELTIGCPQECLCLSEIQVWILLHFIIFLLLLPLLSPSPTSTVSSPTSPATSPTSPTPSQVLCNTGSLSEFPLGLPNVTQDISITNQRITTVPKYVSDSNIPGTIQN